MMADAELLERARTLFAAVPRSGIVPWEQLRLGHGVDGSAGSFRAPPAARYGQQLLGGARMAVVARVRGDAARPRERS